MALDQSTVVIREARPDEREAIARATREAYAEYATIMSPEGWAGLSAAIDAALVSNQPVLRLVADDRGKIVGSAMLYAANTNAYGGASKLLPWPEVRLVVVVPEARGRGISRRLMEDAARRARESGATAVGIHTSASMRAAVQLYKSMGFVRAPEFDFRPSHAELVEAYRLALDGSISF